MARILIVGNATLDIINIVDCYPGEDEEIRAEAQHVTRGGNAGNTAVVLSQLGHSCTWAGMLAEEPDAQRILEDFHYNGVDTSAAHLAARGKVPTSYVILNRRNGSRTIVHYRDLPEYAYDDFRQLPLDGYDWVHFEGRNIADVSHMIRHARRERPGVRLSLEVEKPRPGIEELFGEMNLLLFSRAYARSRSFRDAGSLLQKVRPQAPQADLVCAWGDRGAEAITRSGEVCTTPAFDPPLLVDTLGAGDVFNAGIIDALVSGKPFDIGLINAARLAGRKCGQYGLHGLVR